jgi:hypothetical protein
MWMLQSLLRQKFTLRLLVVHIKFVCQPGPLALVCKSLVVREREREAAHKEEPLGP